MRPEFVQRVLHDIDSHRASAAKLRQEADKKWQAGEYRAYWALTLPRSLGDLLYLIDQTEAARAQWEADLQIIGAYVAWTRQQQRPLPATPYRAGYYLRLGQHETARQHYQEIAQSREEPEQEMLSLALINSGAVGQGRRYLQRRVARLERDPEPWPGRWYHLAECCLWLGDRRQAIKYIVQAIQHWPEQPVDAPVQGLHRLISFSINHSPDMRAQAIHWLEAAIESLYAEGDIEHAMDAKEYIALLDGLQDAPDIPRGFKIVGMTFAR